MLSEFGVGRFSARSSPWEKSVLVELRVDERFQFLERFTGIGPFARSWSFDPCPAASIIKPMMLLPLTSSPSF